MADINGGDKIVLEKSPKNEGRDPMRSDAFDKFTEKMMKLRTDAFFAMEEKMDEMMQEVGNLLGKTSVPHFEKDELLYDKIKYQNRTKPSEDGNLPDKQFLPRESVLTYLFEIRHFRTIYNIFIVILMILFLHTAIYDVFVTGELNLGLSLIQWNFGGLSHVAMIWLGMMITTLTVYPCFSYWCYQRISLTPKSILLRAWDWGWLCALMACQALLGIVPVVLLLSYKFPPASSFMLLMEQVRLMMKIHAFVRSNIPRALQYKPHTDVDSAPCPEFEKFLYFLFAPTLVYQDSYPRTKKIHWKFVAWHFLEVVGVIFYSSYLFERFLIPMFRDYGVKHFSLEKLVISIFGSMMPATLAFLCTFYGLLHSWMNAFAELMRFADRMFYKDWWNANSYASYYRMWNVVIHDWLYTYIYKDCFLLFGGRMLSTIVVFLVSALVHEYILMFAFKFCYPVLFFAFGVFSASLVFLTKDSSKGGNLFMWLTLCTGTGLLTSLYSMEWYARINCPRTIESSWDFFIPQSWFCNASN
ncbi:sterol O-acyltransferase 1 [Anabrus simplex]|uniref:sterol O-acyltransferase 1 n=1 Tax=Anabrus simplex TaxID=316456 RepID=UPI0035A3B52B